MKILFLSILFAWMVVSGDGHLQPASQNAPFYTQQYQCQSVAEGLGHGASCVYVSVPQSLAVN